MNKPKCYIAHTLDIRDFVADTIIPQLEEHFQVENPFSKTRRDLFRDKTWEEIHDLVADNRKTSRWIVSHDLKKIDKCDCLFAYIPNELSIGVLSEIAYACFVKNIPIACVIPDDKEKLLRHPWLNYMCVSLGKISEFNRVLKNLDEWFEE